ncbi:MAG: hypothetical protein Q8S47_02505 [Phenylobacterium sp.]|uniref:hypothetical protein n=1 Tax=Phenylobacterium sp. TaxID=1871053 RepID=UPI0027315EE7|nr:hypothetical protein [Phenylobacterium sp.]MDP1618598.1 hypothetical protein [Phenylobacterium sp.]MDP1989163.1 hypothetical protein [Phenylobacterium sp.]MDP3382178.1 hypothetical protein [Phenylobacterium sp.]
MIRFKETLPRAAFGSILALGLLVQACGEAPVSPGVGLNREPQVQATYTTPPRATGVTREGEGRVLSGRAAPSARVRLATPEGEVRMSEADAKGAWRIGLPVTDAPQIFGLSMTLGERTIQAEGYQLVLPDDRLVLLRAGAGAVVAEAPSTPVDGPTTPRLLAFDFDEEGGAVVSGQATPEIGLSIRIDGRPVSTDGATDAQGRFSLPFGAPVPPGTHRIDVMGEQLVLTAQVDATPAEPPESGAFTARPTSSGLRIDWLTPGGGVQSTLLLD